MKTRLGLAAIASVFAIAGAAQASVISFQPGDASVPVSPPFGALVAGGALADNYINFGVDFTWGGVEGIFNDPPLAFGGVNGAGNLDLVSDVDGQIVVQGTHTQGVTDFIYAEAGNAADGRLTLTAYDLLGNVLGSALNGPPSGDNGRTTFSISTAGIAFFRVSGQDTYGVNQIRLDTPIGAGGVPEPTSWALMLMGFGGLGAALRSRRRTAAATA